MKTSADYPVFALPPGIPPGFPPDTPPDTPLGFLAGIPKGYCQARLE